LKVDW